MPPPPALHPSPSVLQSEWDFDGRIALPNTVASRALGLARARWLFQLTKLGGVAAARGVLAAVGVAFAFTSLLDVTPPWTAVIYTVGLAPEIVLTMLFVDVRAHAKLLWEFEYAFIVISVAIFAALMADALQDARALVPVTIFLVLLASQAADVSYPYVVSSKTDLSHSLVGALALIAVYCLFQFGGVSNLEVRSVSFSSVGGFAVDPATNQTRRNAVTFTNVQFAADRLLMAAFFLLKQSVAIVFRPHAFLSIRQNVTKIVVPDSSDGAGGGDGGAAVVAAERDDKVVPSRGA